MKKWNRLMCIVILLLTTLSTAYAGVQNVDKNISYGGIEQRKEIKSEMKGLESQIQANNDKIKALKGNINSLNTQLKVSIHQFRKSKQALTQAQVANLKTVLALVKSDREKLNVIKNDGLKLEMTNLKNARQASDLGLYEKIAERVLAIQSSRLTALDQISQDLKTAIDLIAKE